MADIDIQNLEKEVKAIISEVTEIEPEKITPEADFIEALGMDSMMALEILASLEKKYKIRIPEQKLMELKNLKEAVNLTKEFLATA
ncbi:acyl carrier protein [Candidatus Omnitrophota bacterium]